MVKRKREEKRVEEEKVCSMHSAAKSYFRAVGVSDMMSIARKLISSESSSSNEMLLCFDDTTHFNVSHV
jgi:hypothetical protein